MLYKKNRSNDLSEKLFKNPTSEYRGTPFWAWNCVLDKDELLWQIEQLKKMGFGGFHIHSRTGMATDYLSDEFMNLVNACISKAGKEKMLAWLYDEDRWPSGAAGGFVTKNPEYRQRMLIFSRNVTDVLPREEAVRTGGTYLVGKYIVGRNNIGELTGYRMTEARNPQVKHGETLWYAYCSCAGKSPWFNNQTYVDTLSKEAMAEFIKVTHERYKECCGTQFDKTVPAIFTDEPQFAIKSTLGFGTDNSDIRLPWTPDLPETYIETYGESILPKLPELFWDKPDGEISVTRYRYHDHVAERFAQAFADQVGAWCKNNNIMLTGHMMEEPTLESQTHATGDVMRSYRSFQLPGIDMLCNSTEYTTAKQAQSAANQFGCPGVLSELYGVTNWDFDFRGHKFQGDWQAALGISVRVPHLSWVSMAGEAKRDYPASINYQSSWYKEYSYIEDHFARINTAMTRGVPVTDVGVIHPIESYWLHYGPRQSSFDYRKQMQENFDNITRWLLFGNIDFDFICESHIPEIHKNSGNGFIMGKQKYRTVIVPGCETLRKTTVDALYDFCLSGGDVVFLGNKPSYVDALRDSESIKKLDELYEKARKAGYTRKEVLDSLSDARRVTLMDFGAVSCDNYIYRMRKDKKCMWLFIANGIKPENPDVTNGRGLHIEIKGRFVPELYDTLSGKKVSVPYSFITKPDGTVVTRISMICYDLDSILLRLNDAAADDTGKPGVYNRYAVSGSLKSAVSFDGPGKFSLSEQNVLLLDTAEYSWDGGELHNEEELLRADDAMRSAVGWPRRSNNIAQPWVIPDVPCTHTMYLKFRFDSSIAFKNTYLALEDAENTKICLNGEKVESNVKGYFTDKSIKKVKLPRLAKGVNVLELTVPVSERSNIEWCYILGNFGVRLEGRKKTLVSMPKEISFGSITTKGMPFYGANINYERDFTVDGSENRDIVVKVQNYRGAVVGVTLDGKKQGYIAFKPNALIIKNVAPGNHKITFTLFGTRYNCFAPLHLADPKFWWIGPDAWRTTGDNWTYDYMLRDMGIIISPVIEIFGE